ncbi:tumor necrosis factor receptor superfamily member 13B [Anabas testudineus]|uniref:TACI cysteine-rich domain-containing protein n=1 Tax=Anabas testudineus TaxID=64144 RepID=A0A3Q1H3I2_ANATE|nr:tumor necrosis factor receptor superfamily member 13B [Anabas testudineus]
MGGKCHEGEHWDGLVKKCMQCHLACQQPRVNARCISYCESEHCRAVPGRFYDRLLKKCMSCTDVCGRHPAECSQHCQAMSPHATIKMISAEVTQMQNSRDLSVITALEESSILVYSLLALCMVLVVSSLCIALAIFPRRSKDTASKPGPKKANQKQECVVKLGEEVGLQRGQQSSHAFVTSSSRPADREPSDDSSPTETCVCVHCFPDLKTLGQGNDSPLRAPFTFYQQAVLQKAQSQKETSLWTEDSLYSSGMEVHEEAAVG